MTTGNGNGGAKNKRAAPSKTTIAWSNSLALFAILSLAASFMAGRIAQSRYGIANFSTGDETDETTTSPEEEIHRSCQHLMMDLNDLDPTFLESESALSSIIVETAEEFDVNTTQFSPECSLRKGVNCHILFPPGSFISIQSHVSKRVAMMDVVICDDDDDNDLFEVIEVVEEAFEDHDQDPHVVWSIKVRGCRSEKFNTDHFIREEHAAFCFKELVGSAETPFQTIEVYDYIGVEDYRRFHNYQKAETCVATDGNLCQPERAVFLNGVIQSTRTGDAAYHEALVHPAMFAHKRPERVAIIGGGEGATLREVLKHKSIKQAIMVEIDAEMMSTSRELLPSWNSCADILGSTECCFDDPRATVYAEDALAWFIDRFYKGDSDRANEKGLENAEPMDVIIMDALDPADEADFCEMLYSNNVFLESLYNALSEEGILVMQLGEAPHAGDAPDMLTVNYLRASVVQKLGEIGFESIQVFDEDCEFEAPWTYLFAFKDWHTRKKWFSTEAEMEREMHIRAMPTRSGRLPFQYFDGATMMSYQQSSRQFQEVFCKQHPTPVGCEKSKGYDQYVPNVPMTSFEVKKSGVGGQGLFATVDIARGSYIAANTNADALLFSDSTMRMIYSLGDKEQVADALDPLYRYSIGYGFESDAFGGSAVVVDSSMNAFINHGYNGTDNVRMDMQFGSVGFTESSADKEEMSRDFPEGFVERFPFNPAIDGHLRRVVLGGKIALRDIRAGEEIFDSYSIMTSSSKSWNHDVRQLRSKCRGQAVGDVSECDEREL